MELDNYVVEETEESSRFGMSIVLIFALILMMVAFVWFVIRLDPLTSDFIETEGPAITATPESIEP